MLFEFNEKRALDAGLSFQPCGKGKGEQPKQVKSKNTVSLKTERRTTQFQHLLGSQLSRINVVNHGPQVLICCSNVFLLPVKLSHLKAKAGIAWLIPQMERTVEIQVPNVSYPICPDDFSTCLSVHTSHPLIKTADSLHLKSEFGLGKKKKKPMPDCHEVAYWQEHHLAIREEG